MIRPTITIEDALDLVSHIIGGDRLQAEALFNEVFKASNLRPDSKKRNRFEALYAIYILGVDAGYNLGLRDCT